HTRHGEIGLTAGGARRARVPTRLVVNDPVTDGGFDLAQVGAWKVVSLLKQVVIDRTVGSGEHCVGHSDLRRRTSRPYLQASRTCTQPFSTRRNRFPPTQRSSVPSGRGAAGTDRRIADGWTGRLSGAGSEKSSMICSSAFPAALSPK